LFIKFFDVSNHKFIQVIFLFTNQGTSFCAVARFLISCIDRVWLSTNVLISFWLVSIQLVVCCHLFNLSATLYLLVVHIISSFLIKSVVIFQSTFKLADLISQDLPSSLSHTIIQVCQYFAKFQVGAGFHTAISHTLQGTIVLLLEFNLLLSTFVILDNLLSIRSHNQAQVILFTYSQHSNHFVVSF